jgi:hypothetical protein
VAGCGAPSQDAAILEAFHSGKQTKLHNPSSDLVDALLGDSQASSSVQELWLQDIDLKEPQWASLASLSQLTNLNLVNLYNTKNSDTFAESLSDFKTVKSIGVYETDLSDDGLKHIAGMPQLENLTIEFRRDRITPDGLMQLAQLSGLKQLKLTSEAKLDLRKLNAALPNAEVTAKQTQHWTTE